MALVVVLQLGPDGRMESFMPLQLGSGLLNIPPLPANGGYDDDLFGEVGLGLGALPNGNVGLALTDGYRRVGGRTVQPIVNRLYLIELGPCRYLASATAVPVNDLFPNNATVRRIIVGILPLDEGRPSGGLAFLVKTITVGVARPDGDTSKPPSRREIWVVRLAAGGGGWWPPQ